MCVCECASVCGQVVPCQRGHLRPKDAQCSLDKVPVLLKLGREVTRETHLPMDWERNAEGGFSHSC